MKSLRIFMLMLTIVLLSIQARAYEGISATDEDIARLKRDIKEGKLKVGITRLTEVIHNYGEPDKKIDSDRKVNLEYGDVKVEFEKKQYWRTWSYDYSHKPAYTDKINTLRKKLAGDKIAGSNIPIEKFVKDYDEPTEIYLKAGDGEVSSYYYGEMLLTFENVYTIKNWEGKNFKVASDIIQTANKNTPQEVQKPKEEKPMEKKAEKSSSTPEVSKK